MSKFPRHVLLIDGDPMVLAGMKLLLQDLHCEVTVIHDQRELPTLGAAHPAGPQLIIAFKTLECGTPAERLIHAIRAHYRVNMPAILLATDHGFNSEPARHDNILVMTDGLNPPRLRKIITQLLDSAGAVTSD